MMAERLKTNGIRLGPPTSTPKADALANHVPAGWPDESLAGSDSEELDTEPHLKVETKVSVELHRQRRAITVATGPLTRKVGSWPSQWPCLAASPRSSGKAS